VTEVFGAVGDAYDEVLDLRATLVSTRRPAGS